MTAGREGKGKASRKRRVKARRKGLRSIRGFEGRKEVTRAGEWKRKNDGKDSGKMRCTKENRRK